MNLQKALRGEGAPLLETCQQYLSTVQAQHDIENLDLLFRDEKSKKIIKQSCVLERTALTIIIHSYLDKKTLQMNLSNLRNIMQFCYQNFQSMFELIIRKTFNNESID
jgi:hypothetical protein